MRGLLKLRLAARALFATYFSPLVGGLQIDPRGRLDSKSIQVLRSAARIRAKEKKR